MSDKYQLESLGILASSVAHDLNNILTGVLGHVSYLRLSLSDTHGCGDSINAIEDGARRAAGIVQKILDFSKGAKTQSGPVEIIAVVKSVLMLLGSSIPENIKIYFEPVLPEIYIHGDESQFIQLIINLIINSKDAVGNSGEVTILTEKIQLREKDYANSLGINPGDYALISVADNGQGIPKEIQDKIFEPFFTTKNSSGTGLGLSIVFSIVKSHQGSISLVSEEGKGTKFEVLLPLCKSPPGKNNLQKSQKSKKSAVENAVPLGTERILVVDDEESVRIVVQRSLEHLGYKVIVASNGLEGVEIYSADPANFDLVIVDMIMPLMSGDELFEKLKELNPEVAVLLASGYSSDSRARAILDNGGLGFIQKPFAIEELAQEVRRCLDIATKL